MTPLCLYWGFVEHGRWRSSNEDSFGGRGGSGGYGRGGSGRSNGYSGGGASNGFGGARSGRW